MNAPTRYNARARQSTAGGSSHKNRKRVAAPTAENTLANPNAEIVVPKTKEDKELDRKQRIQQEVLQEYRTNELSLIELVDVAIGTIIIYAWHRET
jgi:ATP-dependent RNA helicase DHX37/DHR1